MSGVQCSKTERMDFMSYLNHSQEKKMDTSLSWSIGCNLMVVI